MGSDLKRITAVLSAAAMAASLFSCTQVTKNSSQTSLTGLDAGENSGVLGSEHIYTETTAVTETTTTTTTVTQTTTTTQPTTTTTTMTTQPIVKGDLCDCAGNVLVYSEYEGDTEARYYDQNHKISFANILSRESGGLDSVLDEQLREKNPTPVQGKPNVGKSARLTFDSAVQDQIYNYMQSSNIVGSVVVMRTDGSVMSEVSYPSYDPDMYRADHSYADTLPSGAFLNRAFQNASPGSCFKIMSAVIAAKHGVTSLPDEGNWEYSGTSIHNWDWDSNRGSYPMAERTLSSAIVNSSNVFFAKAFQQIGTEEVLTDLADIFHFARDYDIDCDFGPFENYIEINCDDDLRRSAFGQSYVKTCPLYLAALGREAVFGDMVRPFTVKEYADTNDGKTSAGEGSKAYDVIGTIPEECRQVLLDGMKGVADKLGVYVPDGYTLYAKTGTAEVGAGDYLYITGCLKNNSDNSDQKPEFSDYSDYGANGSYIVVMQIQNPGDHNFRFASDSAKLYGDILRIAAGY